MSSIESLRRALGKVVDGDLNSLLQYSATPLQQPILKLPRDLAEKAVRMHSGVLEYTEGKLSAVSLKRCEYHLSGYIHGAYIDHMPLR